MRSAVITGTSSGIGLATALTLARAGYAVFAGMRDPERGGTELRKAVDQEALPVTIVQLDVDSDDSVERAARQVTERIGPIDALVNNAGVPGNGPIEETPLLLFRQTMETNFFGAMRCIKAFLPGMIARRQGTIVNVTSLAGRIAAAPQSPYVASKWALEGVSECLAQEMRAFNIRVAVVEPGITATPIFAKSAPPSTNPMYPHARRLRAFFSAIANPPASPFVVADRILGIVDSDDSRFRHTTGTEANALLKFRQSLSDEEWVSLGALTDEQWDIVVRKHFGVGGTQA